MPMVSACVITYNEEAKLAACLESLVGVADEIVVVDSESTDATVAIAARFTDRIITQPFLGYVAQKNFAVDAASHDWILSLDADERLSDRLRSEILAEKDALGSTPGTRCPAARSTWIVGWTTAGTRTGSSVSSIVAELDGRDGIRTTACGSPRDPSRR